MRYTFYSATLCIVLFCCCLACHSGNQTGITISETGNKMKLSAHYNPNKTSRVHDCINKFMAPGKLLVADGAEITYDSTTADKGKLHVEAAPGKIFIRYEKHGGSIKSDEKVKDMFQHVKQVVSE